MGGGHFLYFINGHTEEPVIAAGKKIFDKLLGQCTATS